MEGGWREQSEPAECNTTFLEDVRICGELASKNTYGGLLLLSVE